ncbi:MAG: type IVB secretion system protein IcmH/DotU [Colwellia sp.]
MNQQHNNRVTIDFSDKVFKETALFDYNNNSLYNLSVPLFSIMLTLPRLPKPDNLALFKGLLKQSIIELSERGKVLDYPAAVIDKLCCLHCIVLDEFIIHGLWGENAGWENNTLLSELFSLKNGGDLFFTITDKALAQAVKMTDLLAISYVLLQMGFKGRYRSREVEQLGLVNKNIRQAINRQMHEADILLKDAPKIKSLSLRSGIRYFSMTAIILFSLLAVTAFFDYWSKETYDLRTQEFTELKQVTANYILNNNNRDIIYLSTAEDIHSVKNLFHTKINKEQANAVTTKVPVETIPISASYRVQVASFSQQENAQLYLAKLHNSDYALAVQYFDGYFIVFSLAQSMTEAKKQQGYFKTQYQLSVLVNKLSPNGAVL